MASYESEYKAKLTTAAEAVKLVKSGDRVWCGLVNSFGYALMDALWERRDELEDVTIGSSQCIKPTPLLLGTEPNPFKIVSPFIGPGERGAQKVGRPVEFTSLHLSNVDQWMFNVMRPTVAFFCVSEPDENGYVSFGPSGGCVNKYVAEKADRIILQINKNVPFVLGEDITIHISKADAIIECEESLPVLPKDVIDEQTQQISEQILPLVPDGATIQLGIGSLSSAIGYGLMDKNDLGLHTELLTDSMMMLIKNGNVTNKKKGFHDGKSIFAFAMGSKDLYEFLDHNEDCLGYPFPYVNDPRNIMKNNRMISINAAMSIDLYGQVAADNLSWKQQSAIGGQMDFVKGAQWSNEGKSIIALASSFEKNGKRFSKIALNFPVGTAVTTPRSEVQYIATEFGVVNLKPLTVPERAKAIISLAHPDFRDELTEQAKAHGLI